jgi:hypothetical protein
MRFSLSQPRTRHSFSHALKIFTLRNRSSMERPSHCFSFGKILIFSITIFLQHVEIILFIFILQDSPDRTDTVPTFLGLARGVWGIRYLKGF